ncbi:MAG: hypothetical protein AUK47_19575 [Deltaproteobacteria bacterium CG2_30_63_29]|nr:MAG: hypothetical protein AUK47_19575 [Deltaproteobacteria bacterium CG2_30_63_29]
MSTEPRLQLRLALLFLALVVWGCENSPRAHRVTDLATEVAEDGPQDNAADLVDEEIDVLPALATLHNGTTTLVVDPAASRLQLFRGDSLLLEVELESLQLGVVGAFDDAKLYDPYGFFFASILTPAPPLKRWVSATDIAAIEEAGAGLTVQVRFDADRILPLHIAPAADSDRFSLELEQLPVADGLDVPVYVRLRAKVDPTEAFYGLGEVFDKVEHRGTVRAMQMELDSSSESGGNEAHVPIPLLLGTRGWGLFVESYQAGLFDVASVDADRVDLIFAVADGARPLNFKFHLFSEAAPIDLTRHYYELTGFPIRPARWALGPWLWRDENLDQAEVLDDIKQIRDLDLATTGLWLDRPYATAVNTFDFEATHYPAPQEMIDAIHALGLRVALWHTPYLDEAHPATADLLAQAEGLGFYPTKTGLQRLNGWGRPLDFTNPRAVAWWQDHVRAYTDMGVEGFKLDYGEDVVGGALGIRSEWSFYDGSDERDMHARFQHGYHQTYAELLPESGGFLLCRAAAWGDQVRVSVIWPGDLDASFDRYGDTVTPANGNPYNAVGGLPAALVASLSLGPSGFPLFGSDTGGYRHSPPDKETFVRWFESTALSPVMQVGTSDNDLPWVFKPENGFDPESLAWYRQYARLHLRLFPYVWTYLDRLQTDGRPIQRVLGLVHPELGVHPSDVFLLGDSLLAAPVVERGARERSLVLPDGDWLDWWTGESVGGGPLTVAAPLGTLPLFVQAGALVPMLRPTIDAMAPTSDAARVDSYATDAGALWVRTSAGPEHSFELFDHSSVSQASSGAVTTLGAVSGEEFVSGAVFEVIAEAAPPSSVLLDGAALSELGGVAELEGSAPGWFYETGTRTLWVRVPAGAHEVVVGR